MTKRNKKILSIFLKIIILLLSALFIYHKLTDNKRLKSFYELIALLPKGKIYLTLGTVFLLMLFNWFIESVKWRFLVKPVERISIIKAIESVFCGLNWAVFTPNRIGEFGGRVFFLSPRKRMLGAIAMSVGAVSQFTVTNVLGAIAMFFFIVRFVPLTVSLYIVIGIAVGLFCVFSILFYYNIRWLYNLLLSVKFFKQFRQLLGILTRYKRPALFKIMMYSLSRFIVFTSQYCILIALLVPDLRLVDTCMMIFIMFFIQSALPSLDLLDIGVRSMTASFFFSYVTDQEIAIIAITGCIWLVNLIFPAIIGAFFIFKLNFFGPTTN